MINLGWGILFVLLGLRGAASQAAANPFEGTSAVVVSSKIDELVLARQGSLGIPASPLCSDAVFLRRVYLDAIGTLPTAEEAAAFLESTEPDRRARLVDRLLARPEFADYAALKWCDVLRVKSEFPINLWPNAVQAYDRWIRAAFRSELPFDRFVRELLTASGSNFRVPPVNFYRAVQGRDPRTIARAVALTFLGERAEAWPPEKLAGLAAFFAKVGYKGTGEWKEEIVFFDPAKPVPADLAKPIFPDGKPAAPGPEADPRTVFADWLASPDNAAFARAVVNRIWSWLLGRGVIHEPDDMRPDNPPAIPGLLEYLGRALVASHYDLKAIYRLILDSKTYQLSSRPASDRPERAACFACYAPRRLEAEVLIDAIDQITGATERYASAIPEPYTFIPDDHRTITLPDASITSAFLELFGRSPRDKGLEAERNLKPSAEQRLHLLNSSHILNKIQQSPKLRTLLAQKSEPLDKVRKIYLIVLSRPPTADELRAVAEYFKPLTGNKLSGVVDLVWALVNSPEFVYRH